MSKGKIVLLGIVAVIAIAVIAFVMWLPPSAQASCEKMMELTVAEVGEEAAAEVGTVADCVESEEFRRQRYGVIKIKEETKCLEKADTFAELEECEKKNAESEQ